LPPCTGSRCILTHAHCTFCHRFTGSRCILSQVHCAFCHRFTCSRCILSQVHCAFCHKFTCSRCILSQVHMFTVHSVTGSLRILSQVHGAFCHVTHACSVALLKAEHLLQSSNHEICHHTDDVTHRTATEGCAFASIVGGRGGTVLVFRHEHQIPYCNQIPNCNCTAIRSHTAVWFVLTEVYSTLYI
jgi:hypothetical protein